MAKETNLKEDFSDIYQPQEVEKGFLSRAKQNKYHYTNLDLTASPMRPVEIGQEIARVHKIPIETVFEVINAYTDIMIREIVSKGRFKIPKVLDVYSKLWNVNHTEFEKVPNIEEDIFIRPPVTVRPKVALNKNIKDDYKNARRYEEALHFKIEPEDWYKPFIIEEPEHIKKLREKD